MGNDNMSENNKLIFLDGETIYHKTVPETVVEQIKRICVENNIYGTFEGEKCSYFRDHNVDFHPHYGFMITAFDLAPYMAHEFTWDHVENPDKGTSLTYVADHLNISTDDCYAFGDSNNDISMFKAAGHGIAMGNACDELKEIAEYVTDSVNDDGIYHAFKHYHLI